MSIKTEILKHLPKEKITDVAYEAANIVLYTDDKEFFLNDGGIVRKTVGIVKKRIELRPDPSMCLEAEPAEKIIREILGEESGVGQVQFDPQRSLVAIEVEKPGIAIGKQAENLQKIKEKTMWVPIVTRTPPIKSNLIESIRSVLYQNSEYRRKFLHKTGERVYNGWLRQKKEEWIRITYLGAARQVGRSAIFIQTPESRILMDCGIDISSSENPYPHLEAPEFRLEELDAIILSHAHIDHSGLIPYLYKMGFRGPVYCTAPTRDISALLQLDIVKIAVSEGNDPIFSADDVKEFVKHSVTVGWEEVTDITPDVRMTMYNSGHILGSCMIHLNIGNGAHNLLYSADMKYAHSHLLAKSADKFPRLETLLIESTYGASDRKLPPQSEMDRNVAQMITKAVSRGGKVLVPTLGSGRGQEIMVYIQRLIKEKKMDEVPIYIDGMVWDITAIHTAYPEFLNNNMRKQMFHKDNPFIADNIKRIGSQKERQMIVEEGGPCIIIATSGMLNGGPAVFFLRELADNAKNMMLFSCYQAEGTLGRRIQQGISEFNYKVAGKFETVELKLEIAKIEVAGHSSNQELIDFVKRVSPKPKRIIVNHGEPQAVLNLARTLHKQFRIETLSPRNLDAIRIA